MFRHPIQGFLDEQNEGSSHQTDSSSDDGPSISFGKNCDIAAGRGIRLMHAFSNIKLSF